MCLNCDYHLHGNTNINTEYWANWNYDMTTLRVVGAGDIYLGCGKERYANSSD